MKRIIVGVILGLMIVAAGLWISGVAPRASQAARDAEAQAALAALPLRPFLPMLALNDGAADLVVFQDGDEGWFELDTQRLPEGVEIGFHGPRVFDILTGSEHVAVYCGGSGRQGKIIWVIRDGQIARDYAFCNPRRMDLGALRPHASPVEMIEQRLSGADVLRLRDAVARDASRAMVAGPRTVYPYTDRYILTPPLMWYIYETGVSQHAHEQRIEEAIVAHLGEAQLAFRRRPASNPNLTFPETGATGMAIQHEGAVAVIPGVWGQPSEIWIDCVPEACARIATLNFNGLFDAGRDLPGLRAAMETLVPDPSPETSPTPVSDFPTMTDLEDDSLRLADPTPITYQVRFIQRP